MKRHLIKPTTKPAAEFAAIEASNNRRAVRELRRALKGACVVIDGLLKERPSQDETEHHLTWWVERWRELLAETIPGKLRGGR